jgi:hypothetical protein
VGDGLTGGDADAFFAEIEAYNAGNLFGH